MRGDETPRKKEAEKRIIVRSRKEKRQIYNEGRAERDSDNINMKPVKMGKQRGTAKCQSKDREC